MRYLCSTYWSTDGDKQSYLRWLEEMWNIQKFDVHGSTEQEEERTEKVLEVSGA